MKFHSTIAVAVLISALEFAPGIARGTELPGPVPLSKYQSMIEKSPFAIATPIAPAATPPPTAPFAEGLYINGITQVGKDYFVSIASKDQSQRFSLSIGEKSADGITLVGVDWDATPEKSRVRLQKGSEQGEILFDEASTHPDPAALAAAQAQAARQQPRPGLPRMLPIPRIPPGQVGPTGRRMLGQPNIPGQPGFQPPLPPQARRRTLPIPAGP